MAAVTAIACWISIPTGWHCCYTDTIPESPIASWKWVTNWW
ncbi:hypothetical protein [Oscillatoria sp. HE19RPO]|nr:hypothetical protein [Oscillatoria sp. HE19RPO]